MKTDHSIAEKDLVEVRQIVLQGLQGHRARVYLFGSQVKGDGHVGSDIDVGVLGEQPIPPVVLSEVRDALEESHVPYKVDLVDLSIVDAAFLDAVVRDGELWSG